ncbi:MAG: FtsX-like permease family protein [Treponema sp.]|nr:FtsX-like permease family protein [Treponema sp.]
MLCIGISLIPLIAVLCVSDGMISGITGRIIGLSTQDISVFHSGTNEFTSDLGALKKYSSEIKNIEGVKQVFMEVNNTVLVSANNYRKGATIRAVEQDVFERNQSFNNLFSVIEGSVGLKNERSAVICQKIAQDLNVHAGDRITLITANKIRRNVILPKTAVFTVEGIVSCGYQELDALWIFIPLSSGFSFLPDLSSDYIVKVQTENSFSADLIKTKHLIADYDCSADVYTWNELNKSQFENFSSTRILLMLIMLLIVLVASINISSALIMIVLERRKEIAILKSIGGNAKGISFSFLIMGCFAGMGGLIIGLPIGLLSSAHINKIISASESAINFCTKIVYLLEKKDFSSYNSVHLLDPAYYLQNIPISMPVKELLIIVAGTVFLSLAASVLPSLKAGKEKPLDTLRKI